jgi:hypothetical protein
MLKSISHIAHYVILSPALFQQKIMLKILTYYLKDDFATHSFCLKLSRKFNQDRWIYVIFRFKIKGKKTYPRSSGKDDSMKFKPSKSGVDARPATAKDDVFKLDCLGKTIARVNQETSYDIPDTQAKDTIGEIIETSENTPEQTALPPEQFPENYEDYECALRELMSLKAEITDKPLADIVDRYLKAITRKHHAWLWQQNFPDASVQDKDKMWFDLEQADEEAAALTHDLNERIKELLHE